MNENIPHFLLNKQREVVLAGMRVIERRTNDSKEYIQIIRSSAIILQYLVL